MFGTLYNTSPYNTSYCKTVSIEDQMSTSDNLKPCSTITTGVDYGTSMSEASTKISFKVIDILHIMDKLSGMICRTEAKDTGSKKGTIASVFGSTFVNDLGKVTSVVLPEAALNLAEVSPKGNDNATMGISLVVFDTGILLHEHLYAYYSVLFPDYGCSLEKTFTTHSKFTISDDGKAQELPFVTAHQILYRDKWHYSSSIKSNSAITTPDKGYVWDNLFNPQASLYTKEMGLSLEIVYTQHSNLSLVDTIILTDTISSTGKITVTDVAMLNLEELFTRVTKYVRMMDSSYVVENIDIYALIKNYLDTGTGFSQWSPDRVLALVDRNVSAIELPHISCTGIYLAEEHALDTFFFGGQFGQLLYNQGIRQKVRHLRGGDNILTQASILLPQESSILSSDYITNLSSLSRLLEFGTISEYDFVRVTLPLFVEYLRGKEILRAREWIAELNICMPSRELTLTGGLRKEGDLVGTLHRELEFLTGKVKP